MRTGAAVEQNWQPCEELPVRRAGWRKRVAKGAAFMLTLAVLRATELYVVPAVDDALHEPTAQEAEIAAAINETYGIDIKVRCVSNYAGTTGRDGYVHGDKGWFLPLIRLDQGKCDILSTIPVEEEWERDPTIWELAGALRTAAHEGAHYWLDERDESVVVCGATQAVAVLATNLGMSAREASRFALFNAQHQYGPEYPSGYAPPADCVPNGPYDLHIPLPPGSGYGGEGYFPLHRGE